MWEGSLQWVCESRIVPSHVLFFFFFQAEDGIRDVAVTGVQTCALPISDTAHIAAAMTYTLVVIFSVLLARGRVPRREARLRMLLTAGIMFAPQLGLGEIGRASCRERV